MTAKTWGDLANQLTKALGLQHAPIAITFSNEAPTAAPRFEGDMPAPSDDGRTGKVAAGCVFWIHAGTTTFTTVPGDHYNCSVGSLTHGLKKLDEVMANEDVQNILAAEWVTPEEAMQLPVIQNKYDYIVYGPLVDTPIDPDIVLLRINAFQGMLINDAFDEMDIVGKPQCHIIPMAREQNKIAMSTGCMLSRIRTGMSPHEMTCTIPGNRLAEVVDNLAARRAANSAVAAYANKDLARFASIS